MKLLTAMSILIVSHTVAAHPGHDHASAYAGLIHLSLGLALPLLTAVGLLYSHHKKTTRHTKLER